MTPCNRSVVARGALRVDRDQRRHGTEREANEEDVLRIDLGHPLEQGHRRNSVIASSRSVINEFFSIQLGA